MVFSRGLSEFVALYLWKVNDADEIHLGRWCKRGAGRGVGEFDDVKVVFLSL